MMDCPACGQGGCDECGGKGRFELKACPLEYAGDEIFELIRAAELYEKGMPPVAGGTLDQAACFTDACLFVWSEQARWKHEAEKP